MLDGPLHTREAFEMPEAFDNTTLLRIIAARRSPFPFSSLWGLDKKNLRQGLLDEVRRVILNERDLGDRYEGVCTVSQLLRGVMYDNNWDMLSDNDLMKWSIAHGAEGTGNFCDWGECGSFFPEVEDDLLQEQRSLRVKKVLESQVELLKEMMRASNSPDVWHDSWAHAVLSNNRTWRCMYLDDKDEPCSHERFKLERGEEEEGVEHSEDDEEEGEHGDNEEEEGGYVDNKEEGRECNGDKGDAKGDDGRAAPIHTGKRRRVGDEKQKQG
jgi:hypothetical protein